MVLGGVATVVIAALIGSAVASGRIDEGSTSWDRPQVSSLSESSPMA